MIEDFLKAIFGENTGIVMLMTKIDGNSRHRPFEYPGELSRLVRNIEDMDALGADVYINMALFKRSPTETKWEVKAKKEYVRECSVIWLDADRCHPSYLSIKPGIVLRSSPGNYQAFWPLDHAIQPDQAEDIAKRLAYSHAKYGADTGGWQCNKFMRVPGTHNYKPERILPSGDRPEVEVVSFSPERFDPSIFDDLPQVETVQAEQQQAAKEFVRAYVGDKNVYTDDYPDPPKLPGTLTYPQDILELWNIRQVADRSNWGGAMVKALYQLNLSDDEIREAMVGHPIYIDKCRSDWGGHPDKIREDVDRCLEKLRNDGVMPRLNISRVSTIKPKPTKFELFFEGEQDSLHGTARLMSATEVENLPDLPWLIDGYLPEQSHINFYGPSGVGKSFQVLDWAIRIAGGYPWYPHGRDNPPVEVRQGPVVYVVAEGLNMLKYRLRAWRQHNNAPELNREHILFYGDAVQLFDKASVNRLYQEITQTLADSPVLIIFDTLSQCMVGANENSPEVMSEINGLMARLRVSLNCSTLVVHHTGYDGNHERGHSSFPASAATRVKIDERMGQLTIECEKQRGGKEFSTVYVERVEVRPYNDPTVVTSLVMEPATEPRKRLEPRLLNAKHQRILGALYSIDGKTFASNKLKARTGLSEIEYLRFESELEQTGYVETDTKHMVSLTTDGEKAYLEAIGKKTKRQDVGYTPVTVTQPTLEERPDESNYY